MSGERADARADARADVRTTAYAVRGCRCAALLPGCAYLRRLEDMRTRTTNAESADMVDRMMFIHHALRDGRVTTENWRKV